jgi:hypothetical protein
MFLISCSPERQLQVQSQFSVKQKRMQFESLTMIGMKGSSWTPARAHRMAAAAAGPAL